LSASIPVICFGIWVVHFSLELIFELMP
jgi:hypothetical protein